MKEMIQSYWPAKVTVGIFFLLTLFWVILQVYPFKDDSIATFFGAIYGLIALWGAIWGIAASQRWGFIHSVMGKAILFFSLGLFAQEFGQLTLSFYHYVYHLEGLYPSLGDVGYFGSIPLYIVGVLYLAKASGVKVGLQSFENKVQAVIIPLIILSIGYYLFLQGYKVDWHDPIKTFLDFGYPLFQAIYVSLAILTYLLSKGVLGGVMKSSILFILFALGVQFLSDYTFLYQSSRGIWHVGEINDYMYFLSYFLMTLALLQFIVISKKLRS